MVSALLSANTLRTHEAILRALSTMMLMWGVQEYSEESEKKASIRAHILQLIYKFN